MSSSSASGRRDAAGATPGPRLRIGYLARSLGAFRGGVDLYVDRLLRHLAPAARSAGHTVRVLFDDPRVAAGFALAPGEADVARIRWTGKLVWDHLVTPAWCRSRRLDVVLCPRSFRPLALPCRSVAVIYDLMYFDQPDSLPWWDHTYFRTLHRLSLHRCDAVIAFSEFTASRLRELIPRLEARRICRLPPGPPHEAFAAAAAEETAVAVPSPYVLALGGWPYKNARRVVEAFARISSEVRHALVIVDRRGGWERTRGGVAARARELGIADRVVVLDRVRLGELVSLYRRADAFVYASWHEGIGIPPLEAMACGCPVVASTAASVPEVTAGAAVLVDPLQASAIAGGLRRVLLEDGCRDELRRRGHRRVAELSWDGVARRVLRLITSLA